MGERNFFPTTKKEVPSEDEKDRGTDEESKKLFDALVTPEVHKAVEKAFEEQRKNLQEKEEKLQEKIRIELEKYQNQNYEPFFKDGLDEIRKKLSEKDFFEQSIIFQKIQKEKYLSFDELFSLYDQCDDNRIKLLVLHRFPQYEDMTDDQKTRLIEELGEIAVYNFDFSKNKGVYRGSPEEIEYAYRTFGGDYTIQESAFAMTAIEKLGNIPGGETALLEILKKNWGSNYKKVHAENGGEETEEAENYYGEKEEYYDGSEYFEDERGGAKDRDAQETMDINFLENRYTLEMLIKNGSEKSVDVVVDMLKNDGTFHSVYHREINRLLSHIDKQYSLDRIMHLLITQDVDDEGVTRLVWAATDIGGVEEIRKNIDKLADESKTDEDSEIMQRIDRVRSFFTPNHDKIAIKNLQEFYQKEIKFEEYEVNKKMNQREIELLKSLIGREGKVLEMGFGTGRLIKELIKGGFDVSGYDFTERHVRITKGEIEKTGNAAKVFQGDWHNNALADESLDAVYSLGRNILHDYSAASQLQLFREAGRILKKGGKFIFDIANREKGGYQKMVEEYKGEMERRGIRNFRYGTIYDSPDGTNYATRYAYSHEDIKNLAGMSGFRILKVEKMELETGQDDENWYYILEKL